VLPLKNISVRKNIRFIRTNIHMMYMNHYTYSPEIFISYTSFTLLIKLVNMHVCLTRVRNIWIGSKSSTM